MLRLRDQYDWIVIGDHPGALLSAALVARLGLSVLILPGPAPVSGKFKSTLVSSSGQFRDAESNTMMGLLPSGGLLGLCLGYIGILPAESSRIADAGAAPQVVTPDARLVLHSRLEELGAELAREFGNSGDFIPGWLAAVGRARSVVKDYWLAYPDRLAIEKPSMKAKSPSVPHSLEELSAALKKAKGVTREESHWFSSATRCSELEPGGSHRKGRSGLPEVLSGLHCGLTGMPDTNPWLMDLLHAMAASDTSGCFRGGMSGYRELLLRMARRLGATVPDGVECRRVFVEAGRLVGIQASQHGNMIAASGVGVGCSLAQLNDQLSFGRRSLFRALKSPLQPIGWKFTLALTIHEEAIPPGLTARTIWQERAAPALEIEVVNPADYGVTEQDSRFLFARSTIPFTPESLDPGFQRLVAARMFRQLTELIPFLEFHVRRIFPDFRPDLPIPDGSSGVRRSEFDEANGFRTLEEIPESLRCYAGEGLGSRTGIEGLFTVSGESYPRYGTLGGTVAALEAASWTAHRSGLAGPILRQPSRAPERSPRERAVPRPHP